MSGITEWEISSLSQYLDLINGLHTKMDSLHGDLWFRGLNDSTLDLKPGVVWREINERTENSIISEFVCYSQSLLKEKPQNAWQNYALMQHYGLPTRLLDWTKSPLIALYFAINKRSKKERIIWCIDPFNLNLYSTNKETIFTPDIMLEDDGINISNYLPVCLRKSQSPSVPALPIAIEPPFTNKRILAQQGCFTVHGTKKDGINTICEEHIPSSMFKFIIKQNMAADLMVQLHEIGIKEDFILQDLSSLSSRIINDFCT